MMAGTAGLIYFIVRMRRLNKKEEESGNRPKWISDSEYKKHILIKQNNLDIQYPAACIGIQTEAHLFKPGIEKFTYVLTYDRKFIKPTNYNKDNPKYGDKLISELASGSVLIIGAPGTGKTMSVIEPTIDSLLTCKSQPSLAISDPKGELYQHTSNWARKNNYNVVRFNTLDPTNSDAWNPLAEVYRIYHEQYLKAYLKRKELLKQQLRDIDELNKVEVQISNAKSRIDDILDALVTNASNVVSKKNDFFQKSGQEMVKALFLLPLDLGVDLKYYNLYHIAHNEVILDFDEIICMIELLTEHSLARNYAANFRSTYTNLDATQNFKQNAHILLTTFNNQTAKNLTSRNTIDFNDLYSKPTVVYVSIPIDAIDETANSEGTNASKESLLASVFFSMMFSQIEFHLAKESKTKVLERPLIAVFDEFGNIPRIPYITKIFTIGRARNMFAIPAIQNYAQITQAYGVNVANSMFSSSAAIVMTGVDDETTARKIVTLAGKTDRKHVSKTTNTSDNRESTTASTSRNDAIDISDITKYKPGEMIVQLRGQYPYKFACTEFPKTRIGREILEKSLAAEEENPEFKPDVEEYNYFTGLITKETLQTFLFTKYKDEKYRPRFVNNLIYKYQIEDPNVSETFATSKNKNIEKVTVKAINKRDVTRTKKIKSHFVAAKDPTKRQKQKENIKNYFIKKRRALLVEKEHHD